MRHEVTRAARLSAVIVAALLGLAGCTSARGGPEVTLNPDRPATQITPDPHASIMADVLSLDPCALLDPRLLDLMKTRADSYGLFTCATGQVGDETTFDVSVQTMFPLDQHARFAMERTELGGAVAYRSSPYSRLCEVYLPVNYDYAVRFAHSSDDDVMLPQPCSEVASLAAAAAQKLLSEPAGLRRPAESLDAIEACPILQETVGGVPSDMKLEPDSGGAGLATCGMVPRTGGASTVSLRLGLWPESTVFPGEPRSVAGRTVFESSEPNGGCLVRWEVRPSTERPQFNLVAELSVEDCGTVDELSKYALAAVDQAVPVVSSGAQVLLAAGESDSPLSGVCVHVYDAFERNCLPAKPVDPATLPEDPQALLGQSETKPDLLCTAAEDVVGDVFGRDFGAATVVEPWGRACVFVTTDHLLMVTVSARSSALTDGLPDSAELGTVAGYRVCRIADEADSPSVVVATTGSDLALHIAVQVGLEFDAGPGYSAPIDTTPITVLDERGVELVEAILG